jgi:cellulose synthase/poly-beta-1,6-N-acetylglucosamine synthase-like glycosyltransferase
MEAVTFWVLLQALAMIVFVNRYITGMLLRMIRGKAWDITVDDYVPTITVVVPLYNEGANIAATLRSVIASEYPGDRLRIVCVDDCSTDDSFAHASAVAREAPDRLTVVRNDVNSGKRASINRVIRESTTELIVSVDSDVIVEPSAIRELVRRFHDPQIAAVGGWVDIRNKHDNWLTRMQVVKYWYAYFVMKNFEYAFRRVMVLSGCLTAYRRSVLVELLPILESRALLGVPIKYGEDRYLTRQIIKRGYLTSITLSARCRTFVPTTLGAYFNQQLRWRRSNVVDYLGGITHVWRLHPLLAIHYFSMAIVLVAYPLAVARAAATGRLFPALVLHLLMLVPFGLYYRWRTRNWNPEDRVGALSFVPQSVLMLVTYGLLTPLAIFTLDSARWETRNHA